MGKKYVIELPENTHWIQWIMESTKDHHPYMDFKQVEDLTLYTEPDLDAIKQEEYEKGYKTAKVQCNIQAEKDLREVGERHYQKGLSDAWYAARRIVCRLSNGGYTQSVLYGIFGSNEHQSIMDQYSASDAVKKIRQYEQEKEEIKVGDEVRFKNTGNKFVVTRIFASVEGHKCDKCEGLFDDGEVYESVLDGGNVEKTGRHFPEIAEVLQKMKEADNG